MGPAIDWAALAAEELEASKHEMEELSSGGIIVPQFTSGQYLRAWIKFRSEPAMVLYETPAMFAARWLAFVNNPEQDAVIFHDHSYGQAFFIFRAAIGELGYVSVTYPQTQQGRTTPGSIWAGSCPCAKYGGPCPPLKN